MIPHRARLLSRVIAATRTVPGGHGPGGGGGLTLPAGLVTWLEGASPREVSTRDIVVPGLADDIPVRLYLPVLREGTTGTNDAVPLPLVVHFPGGGWVSGGTGASRWFCAQLAARVGAVVAEVGYRLAPEHPFPAAEQDAYAATTWLVEHARRIGGRNGTSRAGAGGVPGGRAAVEVDGSRVAVSGEGAGGNLAAAVALDARDRGRPPLAFQALLYPVTDLTLSSPSLRGAPVDPLLNGDDLRRCRDLYLGEAGDPHVPLASPLLATDHSGLPPALVLTCEHDPLRDDGRRYASRLREAGTPVEEYEVADGVHGLLRYGGFLRRQAEPALDVVVDALRAALVTGAGAYTGGDVWGAGVHPVGAGEAVTGGDAASLS